MRPLAHMRDHAPDCVSVVNITMQKCDQPCRRLLAAGCVPDRAGQPTQIQLHMTLGQLLGLPGGDPGGWPGPGPLASPGDTCDASIVPVVTGNVDYELLGRLTDQADHGLERTDDGRSGGLGIAHVGELVLRNAVALLSGPTGLASRLRTTRL